MTFAAAVKIPTNRRAAGSSGTLYAWYVTCVLTVAYFTSYIDRIILSLLVEPIKRDLGASDTAMSLLLGLAFAVFYAVLGIPIARWADRASRKWIIAAGIFLWSITTAMTGLARTYGEVFIARVGVGVGEAALTPAAYSMLSDQFPPISLSRPMSLYHMGAILGIGTAFVIGGAVAQFARLTSALTLPVLGTIHTWQLAFIIVGFPGLAIALLVALTVAEPARTGARMLGRVSWRACLRFVFERRRAYSALILGPAICGTFAFGAMSWMPTYLIRVHRLPPGRAGLWFGAAVIVSNVGGFLASPWLAEWLRRRGHADAFVRATAYAFCAAIAPIVIALQLDSAVACLTWWSIGMFFCSMPFVLCPTAIQLITPNELRATVSSFYLLVTSFVGMAAGPTLVALISEHYFHSPLALGKALTVLGLVALPAAAMICASQRGAFAAALEAKANRPLQELAATS